MTFPFDVKEMDYQDFRDASTLSNPRHTKRAVEVENDSSNPIPTYTTYGDPRILFGETVTVPDSDVVVLTYTVVEAELKITKVNLSCFTEGKVSFVVNLNTIATKRTAPGNPDAVISFEPFIELVTGDVVEVKFKARANSPVNEVESFINACGCL